MLLFSLQHRDALHLVLRVLSISVELFSSLLELNLIVSSPAAFLVKILLQCLSCVLESEIPLNQLIILVLPLDSILLLKFLLVVFEVLHEI